MAEEWNKVIVITGSSRGFGRAMAEEFQRAGARIIVSSRNAQSVQAAVQSLPRPADALGVPCDVRDLEEVRRLAQASIDKFGQIDVWVNNAGLYPNVELLQMTDETWDQVMDVNLRGVFLCSQVVGIEMIKRKQGKIINISSNISQVLQPGRGVYAISKAGVSHLTKVMALEWAPYHIHVNSIAPAPTMTDLNRNYFEEHPEDLKERLRSIPLGRMGDPKDYVGMAILLASRASDFITGQTIFVDGGSILI